MTVATVVVGTLAAILMGASKGGIPSIGALGVAVLALIVPPVESSGIVLPVLLVGDLVALSFYGRQASWPVLRGLVPSVVLGVAAGYLALRMLDPAAGGRLIGLLFVAAGLGEAVRRLVARRVVAAAGTVWTGGGRIHRAVQLALGVGAGVSTMVANAGGPMMAVYLLRARLTTTVLLGTSTWFFFVVNVVKVPFSAGLGLIDARSLPMSAAMVPGLLLGAFGAVRSRAGRHARCSTRWPSPGPPPRGCGCWCAEGDFATHARGTLPPTTLRHRMSATGGRDDPRHPLDRRYGGAGLG